MPDYNNQYGDFFTSLNSFTNQQGFGNAVTPGGDLFGGMFQLLDFIRQGDRQAFFANNNSIADKIRRNTVDATYFADGGKAAGMPLQAEKGEVVVLPNFHLVDAKADEPHDKQEDGEVSDILPEGSYVVSNRLKLGKKEKVDLEDLLLGYSDVLYDETRPEDEKELEEVRFKDFVGDLKKGQTLAEVMKQVRKKVPLSAVKDDVFAQRSNIENTKTRLDLIGAVVAMNEAKKSGVKQYKHGGKVEKYPDGGSSGSSGGGFDIPFLGDILNAGFGILDRATQAATSAAAAKRAKKYKEESLKGLEDLGNLTRQNLDLALANTSAGIASQDPTVSAANYQEAFDYYRQKNDRIPEAVKQAAYNRIGRTVNPFINPLLQSTTNFGRASNAIANLYGQSVNQTADTAYNFSIQDVGLRNSYLDRLAELSRAQEAENVSARNQTVSNINQLYRDQSTAGNTFIQGQQSLAERDFNAKQYINSSYENTLNQVAQNQANNASALGTLAPTVASGYNNYVAYQQSRAPIGSTPASTGSAYVPGQYLSSVPGILPQYQNQVGLGNPYSPTGVSQYSYSPYQLSTYGK